jgi:hypothetical protein
MTSNKIALLGKEYLKKKDIFIRNYVDITKKGCIIFLQVN